MLGKVIIKNASYLFVGNVAVRLMTAATSILLARYLGVIEYGMLSVALAMAAIARYSADMGLTHTLIREGTKESPDLPRLLGGALKIRLGFALVATLLFGILIPLMYSDVKLKNTAYFVVLPAIWGGALGGVGDIYFQIIQKMQYTALIRIISGLILAGVLLTGICFKWPLLFLSLAYGMASILGGLFGIGMVVRRVPRIGGWHGGLLEGLGAFTLGGLMLLLLPQLGVIILERVTDLQQVGYFSAASRIPRLLYTIPGVVATAFYPQLFHYGNHDLSKHFSLNIKEIKSMSLIGMVLALPFALYPGKIIHLLFGASWVENASGPLMFLAWMLVLHSINIPLADALTTQGLQSRRAAALTISVVLGAVFYWLFGKSLGALGGAIAALLIEIILLVGFVIFNPKSRELVKTSLLPRFGVIIFCSIASFAIKAILPYEILGIFIIPVLCILTIAGFDKEIRRITDIFAKSERGIT